VQDVGNSSWLAIARVILFRSATHQGYQSNRSETPSKHDFGRLAVRGDVLTLASHLQDMLTATAWANSCSMVMSPCANANLSVADPGSRCLLEPRLRYATQAKVALTASLAHLSRLQRPAHLRAERMKDFRGPTIPPVSSTRPLSQCNASVSRKRGVSRDPAVRARGPDACAHSV